MRQLPYVDEHSREVDSAPEAVWDAAARMMGGVVGFVVTESERPDLIVFEGRHPFSRYRLTFAVDRIADGRSRVRAITHAEFPGPHGRVYRALVIGTRGHRVAVRLMLLRIARRASSPAPVRPA